MSDMAAAEKPAARRRATTKRGPSPERARPSSSRAGPDDAAIASTCDVVKAVKLASQELSDADLSALGDPAFRSQASRWRSGSGARRVSAAFARLLTSLHSIRPTWVTPRQNGEPVPVEPLPFTAGPAPEQVARARHLLAQLYGWFYVVGKYWRTVWLLFFMILFPRLTAAIVAMMIRLMIRFFVAIFTRLLREIWFELEGVVGQLAVLSQGFELALVQHLETWMNHAVPQQFLDSVHSPSSMPSSSQPFGPGVGDPPPPPPPPGTFWTNFLLLANLLFQFRTHRQGGVA